MRIGWKYVDDADLLVDQCIGLVHDPKRRLTTIDKCHRGSHAVRSNEAVGYVFPDPELRQGTLCIAAHRDRVRISRRQAALTQRRGETEIRLDFEFDFAIGGSDQYEPISQHV